MRIPQYEQQVNAPSAPQFNQIVDVRNDNLSGILDGLDKVYQVKLQEQEEAKKTGYIQADTSIRMALDKAAFDLQSKIQNGGSYANAEAEYQKAHDAAIAQFSAAFDADESGNVRARSMAEYQAEGLNNLLKIRDRVTSRRRSDAAGSINLRVAQAQEEYALAGTDPEKKQAAIAKMNSAIAGGSGVGLYSGDEGKLKAMNAIKKAESDRLDLFAQNNSDNPQAVLAEIEANQKNLDIDDYISKRGAAVQQVKKFQEIEASIYKLGTDPLTMTGRDVDNAVSSKLRIIEGETGQPADAKTRSSIATSVARQAKKLDTNTEIFLRSALQADPENITDSQAQDIAQYAVDLKIMPSIALSGLSDTEKRFYSYVGDKAGQDIPSAQVVKQGLKMLKSGSLENMEEYKKATASAEYKGLSDLIKDGDIKSEGVTIFPFVTIGSGINEKTKVSKQADDFYKLAFAQYKGSGQPTSMASTNAFLDVMDKFNLTENELVAKKSILDARAEGLLGTGIFPNSQMERQFEDAKVTYFATGMGYKAAQEKAYEEVMNTWGTYKGNLMKHPPSYMGYDDDTFERIAVINPLKNAGLFNGEYKYSIGFDRQSEAEMKTGHNGYRQITYPIYYENESGTKSLVMVPMKNENGEEFLSPARTAIVKPKLNKKTDFLQAIGMENASPETDLTHNVR